MMGRTIQLHLLDDTPDGMMTAEVSNWNGHVLMAPRTRLRDAIARTQAKYTGVYLLLGERDGKSLAYIGEGEDVSERLRSHETKKDWWSSLVIVTTTSNNLNKAHVQFLEARLVEEALLVRHTPLDNGTTPSRPSLSEADIATMEGFLEYLLMVLPVLSIDTFSRNTRPSIPIDDLSPSGIVFELASGKRGVQAEAIVDESNGEFVVIGGSTARMNWDGQNTDDSTYARKHKQLSDAGVLRVERDHRTFEANTAFTSPSAAAAVILGRSANGRIEWKVKGSGKTFKEWDEEQLEDPSEETI